MAIPLHVSCTGNVTIDTCQALIFYFDSLTECMAWKDRRRSGMPPSYAHGI